MTDESPVRREPAPSAATVPGVSRLELWSVAFAVSGGMLAYEILLTRVASVLLTSDHLLLVLGLALLGMALGAIIEYFTALRPEPRLTVMPGFWLAGNGVVVVAAIIALVTLGPGGGVAVLAVAAALPFAVAGLIFSRLFRIVPELTGTLYAADLLGAATGVLLVPATLAALGPVQAIMLFAAAQTALGAMLLIRQGTGVRLVVAVSAAVFAAGVVALNRGDQLLGPIPVGRSLDKDLFRLSASAVGGVETIDSRWSTFGRTDLVRFASDPNQMLIFIDGASLGAKLAVASALLVAQGVPMGMMFPIGLRVAGRRFGPAAVPWMWAINGAASVVGSALAIIVAMAYGYSWSLGVGVVCYVLAAVAAWSVTRRPDTATGTPVARNQAHTNSQRTSRARRALSGLWGSARPGHRGASRAPVWGG